MADVPVMLYEPPSLERALERAAAQTVGAILIEGSAPGIYRGVLSKRSPGN